jgi:hypothetical protein
MAETGLRGGVRFYSWLRRNNYPEGYQVLCFNCNIAKGLYGVCPHQAAKVSSVYRITPVTEDVARAVASKSQPEPVHAWEMPKAALPAQRELPIGGLDVVDFDDEDE